MDLARTEVLHHAGGDVHFADSGGRPGAPTVVCVHGLGSSRLAWAPLAASLTTTSTPAVPAPFRVVAVDLPGHGRSPAGERPFSVRDAADVVRSLVAGLGARDVTLVGHSMGAAVSVLAAATADVDRLVLLAPPLPMGAVPSVTPAVLPLVGLSLAPGVGRLVMRRRLSGRSVADVVRERLEQAGAGADDVPELAAAIAAEIRAAVRLGEDPLEAFLRAARSVGVLVAAGGGYRAAMRDVRAPVHVLHGELDPVLSPRGLRQLERWQPGWRTDLLPGVGHSPHLETPSVVAEVLAGAAVLGQVPA